MTRLERAPVAWRVRRWFRRETTLIPASFAVSVIVVPAMIEWIMASGWLLWTRSAAVAALSLVVFVIGLWMIPRLRNEFHPTLAAHDLKEIGAVVTVATAERNLEQMESDIELLERLWNVPVDVRRSEIEARRLRARQMLRPIQSLWVTKPKGRSTEHESALATIAKLTNGTYEDGTGLFADARTHFPSAVATPFLLSLFQQDYPAGDEGSLPIQYLRMVRLINTETHREDPNRPGRDVKEDVIRRHVGLTLALLGVVADESHVEISGRGESHDAVDHETLKNYYEDAVDVCKIALGEYPGSGRRIVAIDVTTGTALHSIAAVDGAEMVDVRIIYNSASRRFTTHHLGLRCVKT